MPKKTVSVSRGSRLTEEIIDFNDFRNSFRSKTMPELFRAYAVFSICRSQYIVRNAMTMLSLSNKIFGSRVSNIILRVTFFRQFCAGENVESIRPTVHYLEGNGVGSILDYCAEADSNSDSGQENSSNSAPVEKAIVQCRVYDYKNEEMCDKYAQIFSECIQAVKKVSPTGFAAIKITALCNPILLERMSSALKELRWEGLTEYSVRYSQIL